MKKLLGIFTAFSITTSSSLSIISCSSSDEQEAIDKAIMELKDKTLTISVTEGDQNSVKDAIKNDTNFKKKLGDSDIKIESMEFTKGGTKFSSTFVNNTEYEVTIKIKKESTNKEKSTKAEGEVNFKVKIKFLTDNEQVIAAKKKLDALKPDKALIETNLMNIDASKIISEIKDAKFYKDIVKDKIELEGDLSLAKDDKKTAISNQELIDGATVFVSGKIKVKNEQADFKFSIKLKQKTAVAQDLNALIDPTIQSAATAGAFKSALIVALQGQSGFNTLNAAKIAIKKDSSGSAGGDLDDAYITGTKIKVHLSVASDGNAEFVGTKMLTVTWSLDPPVIRDLSELINSPIIRSEANANAFEIALIDLLNNQSGFSALNSSNIEIKKTVDNAALDDDYITGSTIAVTILPKSSVTYFIGSKNLVVSWTEGIN